MANLTLKSESQIQGEILARLISKLGLTDVNPGSVMDVITQAVAQQDFALYYQIAQVSRLVDLNSLTGQDLDNKAFEYGLTRNLALKAQGPISILRPVGFVKVSTTFYAGSPAPIVGQNQIDVNDASNALIGSSGTLILGRGSNNQEQVSYSIAPVNMVTFWRYTLTTPLTQNHAIEETVILSQGGDKVILAGTSVVVPATGVTAEIQFTTDSDGTLLDGEEELEGDEITAVLPGAAGNITVGSISGTMSLPNPPFAGAQAFNGVKFTTGQDLETDDQLRDRISNVIQGISKGVKQAILNAIVGLVDPETAKRVVSASVVLPLSTADAVKVYIDDGTGFEPSFIQIGFETILASANGGEQRLQIEQFPVVKAQVKSNQSEPYDMSSGSLTLQYNVANVSETITFQPSLFLKPSLVTADDLVTQINALSTLLEARTADGGSKVLITAKADTNEALQVTGGSANSIISFPTDLRETINLYVDDIKQSKDGLTALVDSGNIAPYNLQATGGFPQTITMIVDGKSANPQTATFNSSDASDTSAVTALEVANVINRDIAGVIAFPIDTNTKLRIESLTLLQAKSQVHITGGSLNSSLHGLNFPTSNEIGADGNYTFNRELGIIELAKPLVKNQLVTSGSLFTRAKLRAQSPELYNPSAGNTLVVSVDGGGDQTITFDGTFVSGQSAQVTANFINLTLKGATAYVRTIGGLNYLEISSNSYLTGTIIIQNSSTGNGSFNFQLGVLEQSNQPNKAFLVSGGTGPFNFAQDDSLVVVIDNDIVNNTFSILLNYTSTVGSVVDASHFSAAALAPIFPGSNDLVNYYVSLLTGSNTDSTGVIDTVSSPSSGVYRYHYSTVPTNFGNFTSGDMIRFSNLTNSENNAKFVISAVGADYVDVLNPIGVSATTQTGNSVLSERRRISAYNNLTGAIVTSSPFTSAPSVGDSIIVIPSTIDNLVGYFNNTKITSYSLKGIAEGVNNDTQLQLSSRSNGSDGFIEVTGGQANNQLLFNTALYQGLEAYAKWTGLIDLVSRTIYGDDRNLSAFPGVGAAGITFHVLAPTVIQLLIQMQLTLASGISIASVQNEVKSAVTGYVNTLGVGEEVIIERIRAAVIAIPGIVDVVVTTPAANVAVADNQRADVSDTNILIG